MSNLYCKEIRKKSIKRAKKNFLHRIRMNDKDDSAWVFDSLIGFLQGPIWSTPLITFIEEKSLSKLKYLCNKSFYIVYINIYFFLKIFLKIFLKMTLFLLILNLWKITRKDVKYRMKNEFFNFSKALSYTFIDFFCFVFSQYSKQMSGKMMSIKRYIRSTKIWWIYCLVVLWKTWESLRNNSSTLVP